jgi:hypothetical protein
MAASSYARSCGNIKSKAAAGRKHAVTAAPYGTSLLLPLLFVIALLCVQSNVHASATCNAGDMAALLQFKSGMSLENIYLFKALATIHISTIGEVLEC